MSILNPQPLVENSCYFLSWWMQYRKVKMRKVLMTVDNDKIKMHSLKLTSQRSFHHPKQYRRLWNQKVD